MHLFKSAIVFFCFAAFMLMAKPFVGFKAYSALRQLTRSNICVKAFTKRKQEYVEDSGFDLQQIIKRLADPIDQVLLTFSFLLSIVLPALFETPGKITAGRLRRLRFNLLFSSDPYLLNGSLLI
ncbi:MAG TPA: hypothetical protein VIM55_02025 [Mucilaginibacter sp.]